MSLEEIKSKLKTKPVAKEKENISINISIVNLSDESQESSPDTNTEPKKQVIQEKIGSLAINREDIIKRFKEKGIVRVVQQGDKVNAQIDMRTAADKSEEDTDIIFTDKDTEKKRSKKVTLSDITRLEQDDDIEDITQKKERRTRKPAKGVANLPEEEWVLVKNESIIDKIPPPLPTSTMRVSGYYMNNRKKFVDFINSYFAEYRDELLNESLSLSCDDMGKDNNAEFMLLIPQ